MTTSHSNESRGGAWNVPGQGGTRPAGGAAGGGAAVFFGTPSTELDDWLAVAPDGTVTVFSGKVELGTGVRTALAQIVAEELDVPLASIHMVMGETGRTPNEGYTAGSKTIQAGGTLLRAAAAEARQALLDLATDLLDTPRDALVIRDGTIARRDDPSVSVAIGALLGGRRFHRTITRSAPLKPYKEYRVVGTAAPRLDLPAKFTGRPAFVQDLRLPGMLHARVVRPPSPGAELMELDESAVRDARVIRIGDFVAVVAAREEQAIQAARQVRATWHEVASLPAQEALFETLRQSPATDQVVDEQGNVAAAIAGARTQLAAEYTQPYQAHASVGPSCAVAALADGTLTAWCATQGVYPLRGALADLLDMPPEQVRVIHVEGAGCYGNNGADDAAADAALLAQAVGQPVRVQWSREDEFIWEPKTPAMLMRVRAGLGANGRIVGWDGEVWSPSHANRARQASQLLAGQLARRLRPPESRFFLGGNRNAPTNYTLPASRVTMHWLHESPLRVSSMRSLGATANTFANESFVDELAHATGADPLAFRLGHLDDPRARDVLRAAADRAGWGTPLDAEMGRGLAFARYENDEAYVATVVEARVAEETGVIQVARIVVAHDCGMIVNPDGVRNQIEGNVIQGMSRALKEAVRFDATTVTSVDWESYPILRFAEVPEVEVVLLDRPDQPAVGAGEPATITIAPAIANAVFAATGARLRQVPFTPERVRAALQARAGG